jgi:hypothetical protein
MAQDKSRPAPGAGLDRRVVELHEALVASLGGPPPGGELAAPYWDVSATDFADVVREILHDAAAAHRPDGTGAAASSDAQNRDAAETAQA